ncbi:MAG: hypothetical protein MZW92_64225 [Comamonadaceae bacterium]|nr:hypothetical protein [Comamonadaceae bacterium]
MLDPSPVRPGRHRHSAPLAVRWYGLMYLIAFALFVAARPLSRAPERAQRLARRGTSTTCCSSACSA